MEFAFPNHAAKLKEPEATATAGGLLVVRDAAAIYEQAVKILARKSRRNQFTGMGNVVCLKRTHLVAFQRQQGNGMAVITDKFNLKGCSLAMHKHGGTDVTPCQPVFRQVTRQSHGIQFFDCAHRFGNGCAVTKRGIPPPPGLIYHALRTFKREPSGAVSGPSTT